MTRGAQLCGALLGGLAGLAALCSPAPALAGPLPVPAERVRVRSDTVLRSVPRYELTLDPTRGAGEAEYFRRVDQVLLYERIVLDAQHLHDDTLEVHISAWGQADLLAEQDAALASGDFATAWARYRLLPSVSAWGGRRFITWGVPGGLHLDGAGGELRTREGLTVEAVAGRPVVTSFSTLGPHSDFTQPAGAAGLKLGFDRPGEVALAASYLERWVEGLASDRALMFTAFARPHERVDLAASTTVDVRAGLEEARARVTYLISDALQPDLNFLFVDPQKLLPDWSLFSVFETETYGELGLGASWRMSRSFSARLEGAARRAQLPSAASDDADWGSRVQLALRVRPVVGHDYVFELGRREVTGTRLTHARLGASFEVLRRLRLAPQVGLAIDELDSSRTALLLRGSAELPIAGAWHTGFVFDFARTPIALGEVRALLQLTYRPEPGEGG
jgi:hypothetical protein